jgi:ATP-dependent protease ClpP protease subunit
MSELIEIQNKAGKVKLDGQVSEQSMNTLIDEMARLYGDDAVKNQLRIGDSIASAADSLTSLEIQINSPGGSVQQGYRAYKTIKEIQARGVTVTARITKLAASMGSIIAAAADTVLIEEGAKMMIHDASVIAWGNPADLQQAADKLNAISDELAAIYALRTDKPLSDMRALMRKETWMNAKTAIELGFADETYKVDPAAEKPKSKLDKLLSGDDSGEESGGVDIRQTDPTKTPMSILNRLTSPSSEEATAKIEALETQITAHDAEIQEFKGKLEIAETALQEAAGFKADIEAFTAEVTALKAERDTLAAELATAKEETAAAAESAGQVAAETLASIGQPEPLAIEEASEATTDLLAQYEALEGEEKRAFLAIHKMELRALALKKSNL